jgi:hypothetical protein
MKQLNLEWFKAALIRAVRTMAQTALGMLTIGAAVNEINWMHVASVAFVSGVYSLLTSLSTGLPEAHTDGELVVGITDEKETYRFQFNSELSDLSKLNLVTFKVVPETKVAPSQD